MILSQSGYQNHLGMCAVLIQEKKKKKKFAYTWAPSLEILKYVPISEIQLLSREQHAKGKRA